MFTNNCNSNSLIQCDDVINLISSDDSDSDVPHYIRRRSNTEYTQTNNIVNQNLSNNLYNYNNQTEMLTLVPEPIVINVEKTGNTQSNRGKSVKKPIVSKKKTIPGPTCLINPNNSRSKTPVRHFVANKFVKRLSFYQRVNSRLMSKVKQLTIRKQELQDIQIKYLHLKEKVLETEEKLLDNGIDTSEYPVFALVCEDKDSETINDNKYDILLECKLDRENQKPDEDEPEYILTRESSPILEPQIKNGINFQ
ncbi:uncharacterized protein LOC114125814 [Aphis gossypii]|uniref:uncharacterized protein LOC114125814 n=1 Tax=Aphis gossypii TaxID=80765 RepID=UPI00100FF4A1|nr:uncharacterized protein LOC114125814 [Aphis gossypii]XP_027845392.1 uncharacterized protein LOC114125814 [Aphis gossypii]XP_027845393.1 uncharacterized protein LOC114125814 [Aphis gossypii]